MSNSVEAGAGATELTAARERSAENKLKGREEVVASERGVLVVSRIHFRPLSLY